SLSSVVIQLSSDTTKVVGTAIPQNGAKLVYGPPKSVPNYQWTIKFYIGRLFTIQPIHNHNLAVQPTFAVLSPGTQLTLAPLSQNPIKDNQVFFMDGNSIRTFNSPHLAFVLDTKRYGDRPINVVLGLHSPSVPTWQIVVPPDNSKTIPFGEAIEKTPYETIPLQPNYPFDKYSIVVVIYSAPDTKQVIAVTHIAPNAPLTIVSSGSPVHQHWIFVPYPGPTYVIKPLDNPTYAWQLNPTPTSREPHQGQPIHPNVPLSLGPSPQTPSLITHLFFIENNTIFSASSPDLAMGVLHSGPPNSIGLVNYASNMNPWAIKEGPDDTVTEIPIKIDGWQKNVPSSGVTTAPFGPSTPLPPTGMTFLSQFQIKLSTDLSKLIGTQVPKNGARLKYGSPKSLPANRWTIKFYIGRLFTISPQSNLGLAVQPLFRALSSKVPLTLESLSENPIKDNQVFFTDHDSIRTFNYPHFPIVIDDRKSVNGLQDVILGDNRPNSPQWQIVFPDGSKAVPISPAINSVPFELTPNQPNYPLRGIPIVVVIHSTPYPDQVIGVTKAMPDVPLITQIKGSRLHQQWTFVPYPGPSYVVKLLDNPMYAWQLMPDTSGSGPKLLIRPASSNPRKDNQLFRVVNNGFRPLNQPDLVIVFSPGRQGSPTPTVILDNSIKSSNGPNTQWKISQPNNPKLVEHVPSSLHIANP
uniref:Uncharacterized protein n=1 Tax=Romanomermis culicivorax TaxID=13658 RepID=A0A915KIZ2_ROMCU